MSALGAMVLGDEARAVLSRALRPEHFYLPAHQDVFRAVRALHDGGSAVDLVTLRDRLGRDGRLQAVGGVDYLIQLVDRVPSTAGYESYGHAVVGDWCRRELQEAARKVGDAVGTNLSPWRLAESAARDLMRVASEPSPARSGGTSDEEVNRLGRGAYIPTRISCLDSAAHGVPVGELTVVHGPSGAGKSEVAQQLALAAASDGRAVVVVSTELSSATWLHRAARKVCAWRDRDDAEAHGQAASWDSALAWCMAAVETTCDRGGGLTVGSVQATAERAFRRRPGGLLLVDLAHDLVVDGGARLQPWEAEAQTARDLSALAQRHHVAVVAVLQESADDGRSATRGSKAWDTRSALRIRLQRVALDEDGKLAKGLRAPRDSEDFETFLAVLKHRHGGRLGRLGVDFDCHRRCYHGAGGGGWSAGPQADPFDQE